MGRRVETRSKRDVYKAIMIAAHRGRGLRLSADEVWDLRMDDAIETRANYMLTEEEILAGHDWARAKPWVPPPAPVTQKDKA